MIIEYKFSSDIEPTDEQLHLLMQDVAAEVKKKAQKSDKQFFEQLQKLLHGAKKQQLINNPEAK